MTSVFPISPGTQSYDWGTIGHDSRVARYALGGIPDFKVEELKPYAELWMGTHPTLPSHLLDIEESLADHLAAHTAFVGPKVLQQFPEAQRGSLPFLFKILSIRKALSIQSHPDKKLAERLYTARPDIYKDPNHKPEMAIALTSFTALCGFRPLPQIGTYLSRVPELASLVPPAMVASFQSSCTNSASDQSTKAALRDVFAAVMTASPDLVRTQLRALTRRYKSGDRVPAEEDVCELVMELDRQFPDDVGVFCVYLLNVVRLQPGEAIFLGAGEPHAYVSGDIVETMATSDNVLRAGLTPKMRDVPNLLSSLTYRAAAPSAHMVVPTPFARGSGRTRLYDPPVPEFAVLLLLLPPGEKETHEGLEGPSLLIVTEGKGQVTWSGSEPVKVGEGSVLFVGAYTKVTLEASGEQLVLFRAFVEA